jgi:hypothetical protein
MGTVRVRQARPEEIGWINQRYDEVGFRHSDLARECVAIGEVDSVRAGLGRLVRINPTTAELSGMFVLTEFRGQGVAYTIVQFLMYRSGAYSTIYCLPFASFRLLPTIWICPLSESLLGPEEVRSKHAWCNTVAHCPYPTLLFCHAKVNLGEKVTG